jgi:hypothetical protein
MKIAMGEVYFGGDLVGTGIAPVSTKTAVNSFFYIIKLYSFWF